MSLVRGRIQRRQKRLDEAEATFLSPSIEKVPEDSEWACQAWGELALMRDTRGDFDGAVEAIERLQAGTEVARGPRI